MQELVPIILAMGTFVAVTVILLLLLLFWWRARRKRAGDVLQRFSIREFFLGKHSFREYCVGALVLAIIWATGSAILYVFGYFDAVKEAESISSLKLGWAATQFYVPLVGILFYFLLFLFIPKPPLQAFFKRLLGRE